MSKPDTVFKRTFNGLLDVIVQNYRPEQALAAEEHLASAGEVSRTTIRAALVHLERSGIVQRRGRARVVKRFPAGSDYFELAELVKRSDQIQHIFMERMSRGNLRPGQAFTEAELAREAGASTASIREFLIGFSRFGLIEKKPRGGWRLRAVDVSFATELADMRDMFELEALAKLATLGVEHTAWQSIDHLARRHADVMAGVVHVENEFQALDRQLHSTIIGLLHNRFANDFYNVISFIFHYYSQWYNDNKKLQYATALDEHISILEALQRREFDTAQKNLKIHLGTARRMLLLSIEASQWR